MSMYECEQCGSDENGFAGVFIAVNSRNSKQTHDTLFEQKFDELYRTHAEGENYIPENWKLFWAWLGDTQIK